MIRQVLVINSGSSSLKYSILDPHGGRPAASGMAERLGTKEASWEAKKGGRSVLKEKIADADHRAALQRIIETLDTDQVDAVGHRIVHGGEFFHSAVKIDAEVIRKIEQLADLAPLHNPPGVQGIRLSTDLLPTKPQVAVFDTAFHQTLPPYAFHYAIPHELYEKFRIRRYGFHGTSHHYVAIEAARILGKPLDQVQVISAHLGNGCSAAAIRNGKSVDTTMGLTPLEGLVMGTRSGDVDPSLHLFLHENSKMTVEEVTDLLTRKSGLLGVSGVSHDMRSIIASAGEGNKKAQLALDLFCYRLARSILGLSAGLSRVDALIFTGGIGENSALVRAKTLEHLSVLRPELDPAANEIGGRETQGKITSREGLACFVIPTNEELMIARQVEELLT